MTFASILIPILAFSKIVLADGCLRSDIHKRTASTSVTKADQARVKTLTNRLITSLNLDLQPEIIFEKSGSFSSEPNCRNRDTSGTLVITDAMLADLLQKGDSALSLVIMHELAHLMQFESSDSLKKALCTRITGPIKNLVTIELIADFAAGYASRHIVKTGHPASLFLLVASMSDYDFSNQSHHGITTQRTNAFNFGQMAKTYGKPLDTKNIGVVMKNGSAFMRVLEGPRQIEMQSQRDFSRWYMRALEGVYQ